MCDFIALTRHCKLISFLHLIIDNNKKAQLTNPRDAKANQKFLQFDMKTSCRQINDLCEVLEIQCLVTKFLIEITSTNSS